MRRKRRQECDGAKPPFRQRPAPASLATQSLHLPTAATGAQAAHNAERTDAQTRRERCERLDILITAPTAPSHQPPRPPPQRFLSLPVTATGTDRRHTMRNARTQQSRRERCECIDVHIKAPSLRPQQHPAPADISPAIRHSTHSHATSRRPAHSNTKRRRIRCLLWDAPNMGRPRHRTGDVGCPQYSTGDVERPRYTTGTSPKHKQQARPTKWDALHTLSVTETGRGREVVTRIATRGTVLPPTPRYSRCRSNPCVERPLPDVPEPLLRIRNSCGCRPTGRPSLRNRPRRIRPASGQTQSRSATPERQTKQPSAVH